MTDMLVKLYALPPLQPTLQAQSERDITIRRALTPEKHLITRWLSEHFSDYWASEGEAALMRQPVSCYLATQAGGIIGFACYDTTKRGFFGPTGVLEVARGQGTGTALLLAVLHDMWAQGYGYAIIGGVGPVEFYERAVAATVIPDSTPGVYAGLLRDKSKA